MTIQFEYGEAVVRLAWSEGPKDKYNKPTSIYTPETIEGVGVDVPEFAGITQDDQQLMDIDLYLPAGLATSRRDQFIVRGLKYNAINDGVTIRNPFTGDTFPTPVHLRRASG